MVKAGVNPEGVSPTQNPFNGNILFHPPELRGHVHCVMLKYQDWCITENAVVKNYMFFFLRLVISWQARTGCSSKKQL